MPPPRGTSPLPEILPPPGEQDCLPSSQLVPGSQPDAQQVLGAHGERPCTDSGSLQAVRLCGCSCEAVSGR